MEYDANVLKQILGDMMLQNNLKRGLLLVAAFITNTTAQALPFNSFDPRTMAMGGAGVAVDDPGTAPFYNPALLTATDKDKKYSIELPVVGARLYDPGNLQTKLTTLSDNVTTLDNSITTVNTNASSTSTTNIALVPSNMKTVASNINTLNNTLNSINNQPIQAELGAAIVVGVPGKNWGVGFYTDAYGAFGGVLKYQDSTTLSQLSKDINNAANVLSGTTAVLNNTTAQNSCAAVQNGTGTATDVTNCINYASTVSNLSNTLNSASNAVNFKANTQLKSYVNLRGALISEAGISVSHGFITHDQAWSLGVTPKIMQLQLVDAYLSPNNGSSTTNVTSGDYTTKYSTLNMDVGVARDYENGWRSGVVVKNIVPQSFDFMSIGPNGATGSAQSATGTLKLNPQLRLGVSHENTWSTVALDIDLTQNDPAGLENKSQYIALGGELSAWGWAAIRAGYRANVLDSARDVASLGLGISPRIPYFKPHLDLAVAGNSNEQGASLRLGLNF